jgi:hypothetical protein
MWLVALAGLIGLAAVADLVRNGPFLAWINHVKMSQSKSMDHAVAFSYL